MTGRGGMTQGTAEPTHESAVAMPNDEQQHAHTQEAKTQDSTDATDKQPVAAVAATPKESAKERRHDDPDDTQELIESDAHGPLQPISSVPSVDQQSPKDAPAVTVAKTIAKTIQKTAPTIQSIAEKKTKKDKKDKSVKDDSTQRVGVINAPKPAQQPRTTPSKGAESAPLKEEKPEKRANCTSQAEKKREKLAPTTTVTVGQTATGGGTRRRATHRPTESDRGGTTQTLVGSESKKPGDTRSNKTGDQMDYYHRRKKKQLEKCKLILTRNKQLVEIASQRGELNDRMIEDEQYFHGYVYRGDLERMIKEDGEFLVRKSDFNGQEVYVISVMAQGVIQHLVIKQTNTKKLYWVMNYAFKSVIELIDYHYRNNEPVDETSIYIRIPVFRQDWQFSHEQIETAKLLGKGNFGTVHSGYLKRHPFDPPVKVAIKTLTLVKDDDQEEREMTASDKNEFLREAYLMLAVDHPNLVKLFGLAATRMPIQIVMELCDETLLGKCKAHHHAFDFGIRDGLMSVADKGRYVLDAARGLEYLHSCFIIHRDIAARNVLIRNGQAKISDFGLSMVGGMKKINMNNIPRKWAAPETMAQGTYTMHTDVYSFGALIYEVFSFGLPPYEDYDRTAEKGGLRAYIIYGGQAACKLNPIDPDTPVWIKEMIDRCRQRDCYARPLFPEIVKKLETQLGSKASLVGLLVSIRERFQKFIVDMISIADYAAKEENYIKADLEWLHRHTSFESLEDEEQQKALRRHCPYLPNTEHTFGPAAKKEEHDGVAPGAATPVPATIPDEKKE